MYKVACTYKYTYMPTHIYINMHVLSSVKPECPEVQITVILQSILSYERKTNLLNKMHIRV